MKYYLYTLKIRNTTTKNVRTLYGHVSSNVIDQYWEDYAEGLKPDEELVIDIYSTADYDYTVVPNDYPVRPLEFHDSATDRMTCGHCGRSWDDAIPTAYTPVPSGRCPFEQFHTE